MSLPVLGLCRFSYPAAGGFQVEHSDVSARSDYLYAPSRMEERFCHFEAICLPGIRHQTDPDFLFAVVIGTDLPEPYYDHLSALLDPIPQAQIVPLPPGEKHRPAMRRVLNSLRPDPDQPCLQFRHDDDDAIAVDFVAKFRETASDCAPLCARHGLVAFDFNDGFIARPDASGFEARHILHPYWGVALGMYVPGGEYRGIFNFAHNKVVGAMPTITRNDAHMYIRGHNDHNDSRQGRNVKSEHLARLDAEGEAVFKDRFAIDCDQVRDLFGG